MSRKRNEEDENRCVLTIPLITQPWHEHIIEKRFKIMETNTNEEIKNTDLPIEIKKENFFKKFIAYIKNLIFKK